MRSDADRLFGCSVRGNKFSIILLSLSLLSSAFPTQAAEKKNQLEELLIWKISDELKLTSIEEKKFTEILKSLNSQKAKLNTDIQTLIADIGKNEKNKAKEDALLRYRRLSKSYGELSLQEYDKLKPFLGTERMVQYLVIKQDLNHKIKSMFRSSESGGNAAPVLPPPKLIEEK